MKQWRNFDWLLLGIPVVLALFGIVMLYAISHWAPDVPPSAAFRQAAYLAFGLLLFWTLANVDYHIVRRFITPIYFVMLLALVVVTLAGHSTYGAQRWISVGSIQLQPSEPAKLIVALMLARFLTDRRDRIRSLSTFAGSLLIVGIPVMLVLRQPDFGTAAVLGVIWLVMMIIASAPAIYLGGMGVALVIGAPFAWNLVLKPFQRARLASFLQPNKDPLTTGWNVIHAGIAVGSGGLFGQWFSRGTQSRLDFLRVQDKDFMFSVIAEQVGFLGSCLILAAFMLFLLRVARVALLSADGFGRLAAGGVLAMLLVQTFVNVGMNMGIMPVTGIPLPLLSYGGSSLVTTFAALGVLESILLRRQKLSFPLRESWPLAA